jgi:hypothetical protein
MNTAVDAQTNLILASEPRALRAVQTLLYRLQREVALTEEGEA